MGCVLCALPRTFVVCVRERWRGKCRRRRAFARKPESRVTGTRLCSRSSSPAPVEEKRAIPPPRNPAPTSRPNAPGPRIVNAHAGARTIVSPRYITCDCCVLNWRNGASCAWKTQGARQNNKSQKQSHGVWNTIHGKRRCTAGFSGAWTLEKGLCTKHHPRFGEAFDHEDSLVYNLKEGTGQCFL